MATVRTRETRGMITRTVLATDVNIVMYDENTELLEKKTETLYSTTPIKNPQKFISLPANKKAVSVKVIREQEHLLAMTLEDFIMHAEDKTATVKKSEVE